MDYFPNTYTSSYLRQYPVVDIPVVASRAPGAFLGAQNFQTLFLGHLRMDNDTILDDESNSCKQSGIEALEATFELCSEIISHRANTELQQQFFYICSSTGRIWITRNHRNKNLDGLDSLDNLPILTS